MADYTYLFIALILLGLVVFIPIAIAAKNCTPEDLDDEMLDI